MNIDLNLIKYWNELAPGEHIEGQDIIITVREAIKRRGWDLHIEDIMIQGKPALKAVVTYGSPVLSILGEEDVILAAYVDALKTVQWFKKQIS